MGNWKCKKCSVELPEKEMEISHDIPKYLGGTDLDGRSILCKKHHKNYDLIILKKCLKFVGEELSEQSDWEDICFWQKELSKQSETLKIEFRKIAGKTKEEFYG